jgi:peptide/nickel transport system permease protein
MKEKTAPAKNELRRKMLRRFWRNRLAVIGTTVVMMYVFSAIFAPCLAPMDPLQQDLKEKRQPPSRTHLLGTDQFGRDILSRLLYGSRYALLVSSFAVFVSLSVGTLLGMTAGCLGHAVDEFIMRIMDMFLAFPYLLLAILIVTAMGPGVWNTIIAIGVWGIPIFARQARGAVLNIRDREFIQAAQAIGASLPRIMARHYLPNIIAPLIVYAALYMGYAILMESALTFLGLGIQPPTPSWADMIASGRNFMTVAPHIATIPGLAIMSATLGFNLIGDGLRDALDPRRSMI